MNRNPLRIFCASTSGVLLVATYEVFFEDALYENLSRLLVSLTLVVFLVAYSFFVVNHTLE